MAIVPTRSWPVTCDDNLERERRLLDVLRKALMTDVMPVASPVAGVCDICESDIEIGTGVVTLAGPKKSTFTVCGD